MFKWTFLHRITHTTISQSNADSSWITLYVAACVSVLCPSQLHCFQAILYPSPTIHGAIDVEVIYVAACVSVLCPSHLRCFQTVLYRSPTIHVAIDVEVIYVAASVLYSMPFSTSLLPDRTISKSNNSWRYWCGSDICCSVCFCSMPFSTSLLPGHTIFKSNNSQSCWWKWYRLQRVFLFYALLNFAASRAYYIQVQRFTKLLMWKWYMLQHVFGKSWRFLAGQRSSICDEWIWQCLDISICWYSEVLPWVPLLMWFHLFIQ